MRYLPKTHHLLLCLALLMVNLPTWAATCDELRAEIEGKIKSAGVSRFSLTVVDAGASAQGQVVGSCERGAKKIMYLRQDIQPTPPSAPATALHAASKPAQAASGKAPAAAPPASRPAPRRTGQPMITECADGSVSVGGDCKKK